MECAVLKRFLKVQGTFSIKKFLQISLFPHPSQLSLCHLLPGGEGAEAVGGRGWGEFFCLFLSFFPHPSLKWHLPPREGLKHCKIDFVRQNLRKVKFYIITYKFVPKNAMKLHFDKSFTRFFSKNRGVLGQSPKVLKQEVRKTEKKKFIFLEENI